MTLIVPFASISLPGPEGHALTFIAHELKKHHPHFISKGLARLRHKEPMAEDVDDEVSEDDSEIAKRDFGSKGAIDAEISRRGVRVRGLYELEAKMGTLD